MTMSALADQALRVSRDGSRTPVLVVPACMTFRGEFFAELTQQIISAGIADRVRFDWLIDDRLLRDGLISRYRFLSTRRTVSKLNRSLQKATPQATIELATQIGRPANSRSGDGCFTIGVSNGLADIPAWSTAILAKPTWTC